MNIETQLTNKHVTHVLLWEQMIVIRIILIINSNRADPCAQVLSAGVSVVASHQTSCCCKKHRAWLMCIEARRSVPGLSLDPIHSQGEGQGPAGPEGPAGPGNEPSVSGEVAEAGRCGSLCKWLHKLISDGCAWTGKAEITVAVKSVGPVRKRSPFSSVIIMMTVFLHAFVSFNHVWTELEAFCTSHCSVTEQDPLSRLSPELSYRSEGSASTSMSLMRRLQNIQQSWKTFKVLPWSTTVFSCSQ